MEQTVIFLSKITEKAIAWNWGVLNNNCSTSMNTLAN